MVNYREIRNLQSSFTEVLSITDSFSDKVAYEKIYRKVTRNRLRLGQLLSEGLMVKSHYKELNKNVLFYDIFTFSVTCDCFDFSCFK